MKLTETNYYSLKNQYISNSKIKAYEDNPYLFYMRYVTGEVPHETTPPLILGQAVDTWLTESKESFINKYIKVDRRSRKSDIPWDNQLTPIVYDTISNICTSIENSTIYKDMMKRKFISQQIFQIDKPVGQFPGLCGKPDWYKIEGDTCTIVDLKTSATIDPTKFYYHCLTFNYFKQQSMYRDLILHHNPKIKHFKHFLLVTEKSSKYSNNLALFEIPEEYIKQASIELNNSIKKIKLDKFNKPNLTWDNTTSFVRYR